MSREPTKANIDLEERNAVTGASVQPSNELPNAVRKTIKTFAIVGPLTGNAVFSAVLFAMQTRDAWMNVGATLTPDQHSDIGFLIMVGPAITLFYFSVGLILCWPIGILPALAVGVPSAWYGKWKGSIPFWLPLGLATAPAVPFIAGARTSMELITATLFGSVLVIPAQVCWFTSRKHWNVDTTARNSQ